MHLVGLVVAGERVHDDVDAAAKGDAPTEELLGSLEPILLDIANLPNDPSPEDVRAVVERMQRKEMVAALQVHSMQTSRMNY